MMYNNILPQTGIAGLGLLAVPMYGLSAGVFIILLGVALFPLIRLILKERNLKK